MVSAILHVLRDGPVRSASLHDVEQSDAVLVLESDVPWIPSRVSR